MNKIKLKELIKDYIALNTTIDDDINITDITSNLQNATINHVAFYKITDPQIFLERLGKSNCRLIIVNKLIESLRARKNVIVVSDDDFLCAQKAILDVLFPYDDQKLRLIGITGTNGKTTTVNLAMQISTLLGYPAISVGTVGIQDAQKTLVDDIGGTTVSYVEFRKILYFYQFDYRAIFFEVSSHALEQNRLFDIKLDVAAWTNFTQDHLDYHKTMDEYFSSKMKITKHLKLDSDLFVPSLEENLLSKIEKTFSGVRRAQGLLERGFFDFPIFFKAQYNQANLELALAVNESLWGAFKQRVDIEKLNPPKGRFTPVEINSKLAIVDYAHTPDALENISKEIKKTFGRRELTIIFGCGGDRDATKRPLMAQAVAKYADRIFITSDNPRSENPEKIISDITKGLTGVAFKTNVDRKQTIIDALNSMASDGILLIAGKGHEEYQEIAGVKYPFSDFQIVSEYKNGVLG